MSFRLFAPHVTDFWFVDRHYFTPGNQDTRDYGYDAPADEIYPLLQHDSEYELVDKEIVGKPSHSCGVVEIEPCKLTEIYTHIPTGREIKVRRCRRYGVSAFTKEEDLKNLGVFFYRGDSQGEGGSGNNWLCIERLSIICEQIIDGGLIVTDGSNCYPRKNIKFAPYRRKKETWEQYVQGYSFENAIARFTIIDKLPDRRYNFVWQVDKTRKNAP